MKSINLRLIFFTAFVVLIPTISILSQATRERTSNDKLKYAEMTESEKKQFIETKMGEILDLFRRVKGDEINKPDVERVKIYVDSYLRRLSSKSIQPTECRIGDNLKNVLRRGNLYASSIKTAFAEKNLPQQLGIYVAMIESEFCPCLKSETGALGMFQLGKSTGAIYGLKTVAGADEKNPDERCRPNLAARGAALFLNKLLDENFGRNAIGFPLSLAAFNAGEGNMKAHLKEAQEETKIEDISFWRLTDFIVKKYDKPVDGETNKPAENETDKTPPRVRQFLSESIKYVPKFFAAAVIGENPGFFGIEISPLSQARADSKQVK